jgi:hypothetical protein
VNAAELERQARILVALGALARTLPYAPDELRVPPRWLAEDKAFLTAAEAYGVDVVADPDLPPGVIYLRTPR